MSLLSDKIDEIMLEAYNANSSVVWRGILSSQEWKIRVQYIPERKMFDVTVKRRDESDGVFE
jgi:hypothetical protein